MPANTPIHALPYPVPGDHPANYPTAAAAQAALLDAKLPKAGTLTTTTTAGGQITIPHGLGRIPACVAAFSTGTTVVVFQSNTFNASTATLTVRNASTAAVLASTAITIRWMAL